MYHDKVGFLIFVNTLNTAFDIWWVYDVFVLHFSKHHLYLKNHLTYML